MNMNNEIFEEFEFENVVKILVLTLLPVYCIITLCVLIGKYKHDTKPAKIMQISFFFGITLFIASLILCLMRNTIECFVRTCVSYQCLFFSAMSLCQDIYLFGIYRATTDRFSNDVQQLKKSSSTVEKFFRRIEYLVIK